MRNREINAINRGIGRRIKALRKVGELTQTDFGKQIGCTQGLVVMLEAGTRRYPVDLLWRIANTTGTPKSTMTMLVFGSGGID
jgi:transcriptional regulator with XRE-family HTH domain